MAAALFALLEPFGRVNIMVGHGGLCFGSTSRCLGVLASLLSREEDAKAWFEIALAAHEKLGARPMLERTRRSYERMLSASRRSR